MGFFTREKLYVAGDMMADNGFLPVTKEDMTDRGWYYVDFLLVTGDAYVDHLSFGPALVGRLLENLGYRVGIISQPDWRRKEDFLQLGKPRYACLVTAGNLDSMVNHYTANKKRRRADDYSPGGKTGRRPDRATIVYTGRIRETMPGVPVIIGGVEASLRRFAHYDYWDNSVRRSILADTQADLLVYGMAERQVEAVAARLAGKKGVPLDIPGTAYLTKDISGIQDYIMLPSFDEVAEDKGKYAEAFKIQYAEQNPFTGKTLVQPHGSLFLVQNPPAKPLEAAELDRIYEIPYRRTYHPEYEKYGGVPAVKEVEFSITGQRGCFGGCAFCALHFHQGTVVQGRSPESIIAEAETLAGWPGFKGYIHDIGGPTANFRRAACRKQREQGQCRNRHCLYPEPCPNLDIDHSEVLQLLRRVRRIPGVKKVFLRSGLRYDYLLAEKDPRVLRELCEHHVSGQLKVAPEHVSKKVTTLMRKPPREAFDRFRKLYTDINRQLGKKQYLVPYFITGHPGSGLKEAVELAEYVRDMGYNPEQVQDFIPTPGSLSTCMYYTGLDPFTGRKVYVPRSSEERAMQRALLQYRNPANHDLVRRALKKAGREDLIGYGHKCLVRPAGGRK
jgi:uncharacterized radical SAM protein YgiQ